MNFTISEKNILYVLIMVQSLLGLALFSAMAPPTAVGYGAMIKANEAYELGVNLNNFIVSILLGLIILIFIQVLCFWFWKKIFRFIGWAREDRREIPRRQNKQSIDWL